MIEYIKGVRKEAGKVIFPDSEEVRKKTAIVIGVCGACALLLWGMSELVLLALRLSF